MVETGVDLRLLRPSTHHSPMRVTYLTDIGSPFRVIARITGCIICPPAAIHHDISHTRIGCISIWNLSLLFFRFFDFRKGRLHVVSRGYKHVWCTPAFVWRYVQFNLVITMKNVNGESSLFSLLSLQMHLRFWLKSLSFLLSFVDDLELFVNQFVHHFQSFVHNSFLNLGVL